MRWSYTIGRIAGTDIKVHVTFLLILGWWALIGYSEGGPGAAVTSALALLALFACILLHEFGHILMARRFGVRTPDVILLPIGGVARLERIPDEPRQELLIALAGPAVTLAIAGILLAILRLSGSHAEVAQLNENQPFLAQLVSVNLYLLLFNLIPAFPWTAAECCVRCWPAGWVCCEEPALRRRWGRRLPCSAASMESPSRSRCSCWWRSSCSSVPMRRRPPWRPGWPARDSR